MNFRGKTAALLASSILAAHAGAAFAQEAPEQGLSDIVVTATRTSSSVQKVPVAVTAFGADAVEKLQITNAKDLAQVAPNVQMVAVTGGSAGITPFIRGGGVTDGANVTSEAEVGIYIDDVYQPRAAASFIDALDIDRIEVLRGPQGTLYGRNSSAGALKIVTRAPGDTMSAKGELGIGSWDERFVKLGASGPVSEDGKLRAGFSGLYRTREGGRQYNATLDKKVGAEEYVGVQGDVAYVGDGFKARLKGYYSHLKGDGLWAVATDPFFAGGDYRDAAPVSGDYRTVVSPSESFTTVTQYGTSLHLDADLGTDTSISSITAWSHLKDNWGIDFSGGVKWATLGVELPGYTSLFDRTSLMEDSSFSQELQLHGKLAGGLLTYVGGLYYFRESGSQDVNSVIFFGPSNNNFAVTTNSYAAFGQVGIHPTDTVTISVGGRYTEDHKTLDASIAGAAVKRKDQFKDFLPKLGIDWQATPSTLVYASYSEGFKAGGYNGLAGSAVALNSPFAPQAVKAYEVGFKSEFLDRTVRLNVAAFFNDYTRLQQQLVTGTGEFLTQIYAASHKGIEAELSVRPVAGVTLWANGTWNDGKYKASSETDTSASSYVGNRMTNVFKYQVTVGSDLSLPIGPGKAILGANYNVRSDYFTTPDNGYISHAPRTELVNAYVGYALDNVSLRLSAKNLFDERYWTTGFGFSVIQPRFMGDPRSWRLTLAYKY